MVELGGWEKWLDLPGFPYRFHVIYWWAVLVLGVILSETISRGRQAVRWQEFWIDRGRSIGGITEDIGELLIHRKQDGRVNSVDVTIADILRQVVRVAGDLTSPAPGIRLMACVLLPRFEGASRNGKPVSLKASIYNEAAGRHKSEIPIDTPSPACSAYLTSAMAVVPDTSVTPYRDEFVGRPYRSVVAFPVNIGHHRGSGLAVLTIDATEANFFTEAKLQEKGVEAAIFPYIKLIGLSLLAETKGKLAWERTRDASR